MSASPSIIQPKAFEFLSTPRFAHLFEKIKQHGQIRVWIVGCGNGEEVYSVAMLCAEHISLMPKAPSVQIFATDIDDAAIRKARAGLYNSNDVASLSAERLQRFFTKEGDQYKARNEIRDMILFAKHNFLSDPPFSQLSFIRCGNLLDSLHGHVRELVMETFHFALKPEAFLSVNAESKATITESLFSIYDSDACLFQSRRIAGTNHLLNFKSTGSGLKDAMAVKSEAFRNLNFGTLYHHLLETYAPPSILTDVKGNIIQLSERVKEYLLEDNGEQSNDVFKVVRPELRSQLRSGISQAIKRRMVVKIEALTMVNDEKGEAVNIDISPFLSDGKDKDGFIFISFCNTGKTASDSEDDQFMKHHLEELIRMRGQLNVSNEYHEFQTQQLRAANDQLQTINEQMRRATEQLETNKEELQSTNEELRAVNQELKTRIRQTDLTGNHIQNLVNSSNNASIFLDKDLRILFYTSPVRELFNLIPTDIGRCILDITHELSYSDLVTDFKSVLDNLRPFESEVQSKNKNWYLLRMSPYRTDADRVNGVVLTFADITRQTKVETSLRESEEKHRIILDAVAMACWVWETESDQCFWNDQHYKLCGIPVGDGNVNRDFFLAFIHPDDRTFVGLALQQALEENELFQVEFRLIRADDKKVRWMSGYGKCLTAEAGGKKMAGVMFDITDKKQLERQKDDFISIASHELKTPVTGIKAYVQFLQSQYTTGDQEKLPLINKLEVQVERLVALINNLLDISKISEGQLSLQKQTFDLDQMIEDTVRDVATTSNNVISYRSNITRQLYADKDRIHQVLINLINNAIKYSPGGGTVTVYANTTEAESRVVIEDNGIGIPKDMEAKIFERFTRVGPTEKNRFSGMGLGLYISSEIIHRHGGRIKVDSELGKGSVFEFTIPHTEQGI